MSRFEPVNSKEQCPHLQLIELCANLADIDLTQNQEEFCGRQIESKNERSFGHSFNGYVYRPDTACNRVREKLEQALKDAKLELFRQALLKEHVVLEVDNLSDQEIIDKVECFFGSLRRIACRIAPEYQKVGLEMKGL